jgi:AraC family transcriptional activator FtrA
MRAWHSSLMAHRVAALVFDGLDPFELGIAVELFGLSRPELDVPWWYEFAVCAQDREPLRAIGGFTINPSHGLDAVATADTVVVPGCPPLTRPFPEPVLEALRTAHGSGARLVSICSGVFVIAAAGLLDGRRAATHWRFTEELRARHPAIEVDRDSLYVDDGEILTSAGSAAGLDLCLHIVRSDHGTAIANNVARRLVIAPHRAGDQAQFVERPVAPPDDRRLRQAMDWALGRLGEPTTLADLSHHAFMSPRTFTRRFGEAVGQSPMAWLLGRRVDASLALLEETDVPVEEIAAAVGFSTAAAYRKQFRRRHGLSPTAYRRNHRENAASPLDPQPGGTPLARMLSTRAYTGTHAGHAVAGAVGAPAARSRRAEI